ncbi:hypothetical protein BRC77_03300 [Halobacteriales archaeon QH_8_64_26]|nr:MAG: hypothetical protein BRC77_03300 [Halobacteriales archaeon QH_8_64_26]
MGHSENDQEVSTDSHVLQCEHCSRLHTAMTTGNGGVVPNGTTRCRSCGNEGFDRLSVADLR